MISTQSKTTSEVSPLQTVQGAVIDPETVAILVNSGVCPIYTYWAFQHQYGIGWDFAEHSKNIGQ